VPIDEIREVTNDAALRAAGCQIPRLKYISITGGTTYT